MAPVDFNLEAKAISKQVSTEVLLPRDSPHPHGRHLADRVALMIELAGAIAAVKTVATKPSSTASSKLSTGGMERRVARRLPALMISTIVLNTPSASGKRPANLQVRQQLCTSGATVFFSTSPSRLRLFAQQWRQRFDS